METSIDASTGDVTVRYTDEDGKEKSVNERLALPADVANGLLLTLVKHIDPTVPQTTVSLVAMTPKPRLVTLEILPKARDRFRTVASSSKRYAIPLKSRLAASPGWWRLYWGSSLPTCRYGFLEAKLPRSQNSRGALPGRPHLARRARESLSLTVEPCKTPGLADIFQSRRLWSDVARFSAVRAAFCQRQD